MSETSPGTLRPGFDESLIRPDSLVVVRQILEFYILLVVGPLSLCDRELIMIYLSVLCQEEETDQHCYSPITAISRLLKMGFFYQLNFV